MNFDLERSERNSLLQFAWQILDDFYSDTAEKRVTPILDQEKIIEYVEQFDFDQTADKRRALEIVTKGLSQYAVHTPHPRYFGLFNPRTTFASILADLISATFNPQMAAWSHAPYAVEVENYLCRELGAKFGYSRSESKGAFCGGGAEANLTAVLCAIRYAFPQVKESGLLQLQKQPIIYCSAQSHHSVARGAVLTGLGHQAVRTIPVDKDLRMDVTTLKATIQEDRNEGKYPFLVIATAGTTGPGSIDPLNEIAQVCANYRLWFHVDAAYGGAVVIHPEHSQLLNGISLADSITFDIHKWMSVPMATSLFLTKHTKILGDTFGMPASYMPRDSKGMTVEDPYMHSIQWSRRFIGLKLYLSLIFYGWKGYEELIEHNMEMANYFRAEIVKYNWHIINNTALPVVCFYNMEHDNGYHQKLLAHILEQGKTWLSTYPINGKDTIRVCFNNYNTSLKEVKELLEIIQEANTNVLSELN